MEIKKRFGLAVQTQRKARGLSQEELAMRIDSDQAYISRIEAGQLNVTLETADAIATSLGVDVTELFAASC